MTTMPGGWKEVQPDLSLLAEMLEVVLSDLRCKYGIELSSDIANFHLVSAARQIVAGTNWNLVFHYPNLWSLQAIVFVPLGTMTMPGSSGSGSGRNCNMTLTSFSLTSLDQQQG